MSEPVTTAPDVDPRLLEILVCPVTHGALEYDRAKGELISRSARLAYPIRDGVPIMLPEEARELGDGDWGFRAARRFGIAHAVGAVVAVTVGFGLVTFQFVKDRNAHIAAAKAWDIQGPPCPALTQAEFTAKRYTALKTFPYDDVTIGRTAGDASCSDVKDNGGKGFGTNKVCQFTSPATLTVVSPAGRWFFVPGAGQPSTLIIHKDVPRCVMASKFTLQTE